MTDDDLLELARATRSIFGLLRLDAIGHARSCGKAGADGQLWEGLQPEAPATSREEDSMTHFAKKIDSLQPEIVKALKKAGCTVQPLHEVGKGCPDLLVGRRTPKGPTNFLLEVKSPTGALNEDQEDWHRSWNGQVATVRSVLEAFEVVGYHDKGAFVQATLREVTEIKEAKNGKEISP